ncbi:RNA polymerase II transcription factor [Fusarium heterosporum]|uniref:RNA polymerase II transcription factor n=1 Tax=Fusarium heterosporum TaxID=42747 RepID=A0A8H5WXF5_FUSHE|nr:RNA polymerase II transcription factor [Fusarium heterosporum]
MSGLPEGWDADYDGRRWFYKYKSTGHVQYHFPKEGDEFPDFIDTFSPAPDLAPEERLASQRQTITTKPPKLNPKKDDGGYGMSATARPVSMTWDGAFEEEEPAVFQPENFMYLGPGAYTDVSPLVDEEQEAARRVVTGGIGTRFDASSSKGVSPLNSEKTTPAQGTTHAGPVTGEPVLVPPTVVEEIHEMPAVEPCPLHDPVGIIPEMPTYDTAQAHIETHPPPVEMADNMVLAPIETAVPMMAELPGRTSPTDTKKNEPQLAPGSLRDYGAQMQPLRIAKPVEESPGIQSYRPAADMPSNPASLRRATFQSSDPMENSSPIRPPDRGHVGTPNVLSPPQVPPKRPLDEPSRPQIPPKHHFAQPSQSNSPGITGNGSSISGEQPELGYMPSVLKPARGKAPGQLGQQPAHGPGRAPQGHSYVPPAQGKHPPSMTPAPQVQQKQRFEEPRMVVQRVNTVPDLLPSHRPQSTIQTGHRGLPPSTMTQQHLPKRPASVMPDMMVGQPQEQVQGGYNSVVNMPYRDPVENMPQKGLPRSTRAGPTTPFPPYPMDNLPYPDDEPVYRKENPPYPEEPFVTRPMPPRQSSMDSSFQMANNRRHSSFSSALVSPDSRNGSISFPMEAPSPIEQNRRASYASPAIPNYTPSPVSHNSPSIPSFSPTPPSAPGSQYQQGSYFTTQDMEAQVHNGAARDMLRKKSLGRGGDPRRSSVGSDPTPARGLPLAQQSPQGHDAGQGSPLSHPSGQISQANTLPQNHSPVPGPPQQGQQGLGRIEEHEEATSAAVSRSSTVSMTGGVRRGSMVSSAQSSPAESRRASWQTESPSNSSPGQFQGQQNQVPQGYTGQPMPHGQAPGVPLPAQNVKQLQRKPSQGQPPLPRPQSQQIPTRDSRLPQGVPVQQGSGPQGQYSQGQVVPPQVQGITTSPGHVTQNQNVPHGPAPQGFAPKPVPTRLQKRHSYNPASLTGQTSQNQFPKGPVPPQMRQGQMPQQGQMPSQMPPPGQPPPLQMHPGQVPNGRVQPHVQIPQNEQGWQPIPQPMMPGPRPVSMQPQSQSAGAKEGKEGKKWLKWLKGGSKSVSHSPTTPVISAPISPAVGRPSWGGGEYSQQAVWQPGQPVTAAAQPGFQGNMAPPQPLHTTQPMQMPGPDQALSPSVQGPSQPSTMGLQHNQRPTQVNQPPSQPSQMPSQSRQQTGQLSHVDQMPVQAGRMPPQTFQFPPQRQSPPQTGSLPPQRRQSPPHQRQEPPQQEPGPPQINHAATRPNQAPPSGPAPTTQQFKSQQPRQQQPEPQPYSTGARSIAGSVATEPIALSSGVSGPPMAPPITVESRDVRPQEHIRQPSPVVREQSLQPSRTQSRNPSPHTFISDSLPLPLNTHRSASPSQPALSPGLSDAAASSTSRASSRGRDSLSDAGSITTIEVAQAQPQPVLKPSIVQVHRRSTDLQSLSRGPPHNGLQSSSDVAPRLSTETARTRMEPAPASNLQYRQQPVQSEQVHQVSVPGQRAAAAPLFSNSNAAPKPIQPATTQDQSENKEQPTRVFSHHSGIGTNDTNVQKTAPIEDKWAKKPPAVDYSGGDWGDDDDWSY